MMILFLTVKVIAKATAIATLDLSNLVVNLKAILAVLKLKKMIKVSCLKKIIRNLFRLNSQP
jgi:hypothetical protein